MNRHPSPNQHGLDESQFNPADPTQPIKPVPGQVIVLMGSGVRQVADQLNDQLLEPKEPGLVTVWQQTSDAITLLETEGVLNMKNAVNARNTLLRRIGQQLRAKPGAGPEILPA